MKRYAVFTALAAILIAPLAVSAGTFKSGDTYDLSTAETVEDNLYVGGGTVSLGGMMLGDAFAGGGNVTVTGPVADDLAVAGGSLTLLGPVGGDLRMAGGSLTIGSAVGGELLVGGGNVIMLPDASVGGDARLAGGVITVKGAIGGDLTIYAGEARIDGVIEGDVHSTAESLTLAPGAIIKGSLVHTGPLEAVLEAGAVVQGETTFTYKDLGAKYAQKGMFPPKDLIKALAGALFLFALLKFLALLLTSALATLWFKRASRTIVERTLDNFGGDLLTGFVTAIVSPFVFLLLLSTLVGWYIAFLLATALSLACMVAGVFAAVSFGALVRSMFAKGKAYAADWKSAMLGTVLLAIVILVPFVGWIAGAVFYLASFGSVVRLCYDGCIKKR